MVEIVTMECPVVAKYGDIIILGSSDEAAPAYAYSHDDGLMYTEVPIGKRINAIVILDAFHIWMACNDGYIYFSDDGGKSVVAQDVGVATDQHLHSITFIDRDKGYAVGDRNTFLYTLDGGDLWQSGTGPQGAVGLQGVGAVQGTDIVLVCGSNGIVYRSITGGQEWVIVLRGVLPGHIWVIDHHAGAFSETHQFTSEDGGATWTGKKLPDWNEVCDNAIAAMNWCSGEE